MVAPRTGPCDVWELDLSCCMAPSGSIPDPCLMEGRPVPQATIDSAKLVASQLLWRITGQQFGVCTATIRPCRACSDPCCIPTDPVFLGSGFPSYPFMQSDGSWINMSCSCRDSCSCVNLCELDLPGPVSGVSQVKIDGVIVDPATYTIHDYDKLVRLGADCWPHCNDLTKPDTEEGTWSVTVTYGREVPPLVLMAAAEFACEVVKSCTGRPCKLPQRISSVTRQGVSVSFLDAMEFLDQGLTGLYFVDLAARTYNPKRLQRRPTVHSPDSANKWRVTG